MLPLVNEESRTMTSPIDNGKLPVPAPQRPPPDAHGQAGLLLAESILHSLVAGGTWTTAQAIEAVKVAADVKLEVATLEREPVDIMRHSLALLAGISESLKSDHN